MIECPHCSYKTGGDIDDNGIWIETEGDKGPFWSHQIPMKRNEGADWYSNGDVESDLLACPSCGKVFIEI